MDRQVGEQGLEVQWNNSTYMCLPREEKHAGGVFYGGNPLEHSYPVFLASVALSQITIHAFYFLLKPLRQPKFVCSLLAGIFLGPSVLGRNKSYLHTIFSMREQVILEVTSNLGVIYFLFLTMAKMDTALTVRSSKNAWSIGIACMALPLFILSTVFFLSNNRLFDGAHAHASIMVMSFTLSHFPNVAHALEELNLLSSELGQLALSGSAVNEIFSWIGVLLGMILQTGDLYLSLYVLLSAMFFLSITFFVVRPFLLRVAARTPEGKAIDEIYISGILLGALFMALVSDTIGMVLAGSFVFGLAIPHGGSLAASLVHRSEAVIMEFLMPLFYLSVGFSTNIYSIKDWRTTTVFFLLTILTTLLKWLGAFLPAVVYYRMNTRHALVLGLLLNIRGVIELVIIRRSRDNKSIDDECYTIMVLANLLITAVIVPLVKYLYKPQDNLISALPVRGLTAIQKSSYAAELRVLACVHGEENVNSTITVLEAANPTDISPVCAIVTHLVELAGRAAPVVVPYKKNKKMLRSQTSDHIMRAFDNYSRGTYGAINVKPFTIIAPYKTMHLNICNLAREEATHLIIIPFRKMQEDNVLGVTSLRSLSTNLQTCAQCTVGVLVDNGFPCCNSANFYYDMAVIFLGGPDDREALAFATRISGRVGIQMTVIRILLTGPCADDHPEGEKKLDNLVLEEFRMKNNRSESAMIYEVEAKDGIQVVNIIKSLELNYDLLILGRRPMNSTLFSEGTMSFNENPELGVIGDFLVSEDFLGRLPSLLVMQQYS